MTTSRDDNFIKFRLLEFNVTDIEPVDIHSESDDESPAFEDDDELYQPVVQKKKAPIDKRVFSIQMFGLDETGATYSVNVNHFKPFFYIRVGEDWSIATKKAFVDEIRNRIPKRFAEAIVCEKIIKRKKLYGFDAGKEYRFVLLKFSTSSAFNAVKNLWFNNVIKCIKCGNTVQLKNGKCEMCDAPIAHDVWESHKKRVLTTVEFAGYKTQIYESNIPPILRFFHINEISPSGWVKIPRKFAIEHGEALPRETICTYEFTTDEKYITADRENEKSVPYKICSFDIEASSSHGDFPVPVKTYKKLANEIVTYWQNCDFSDVTSNVDYENELKSIIWTAFGHTKCDAPLDQFPRYIAGIERVYPIAAPSIGDLEKKFERFSNLPVRTLAKDLKNEEHSIARMFEIEEDEETFVNDEGVTVVKPSYNKFKKGTYVKVKSTVIDLLNDEEMERDAKVNELTTALGIFPKLEGDKVTFIGSTFWRYGEPDTYLNHCVVLNGASNIPNATFECCNTERELLLAWRDLIQRENPDIIIGYNIFGFDYPFLYFRAKENNCLEQFLMMSRNESELCGKRDKDGVPQIEQSSITIASGTHEFNYVKMSGRIQIDLLNTFRRDYNLDSYKLDFVSGYFISDRVKKIEAMGERTKVYSGNLMGLKVGSYVAFDETGHTTDAYDDGRKFIVVEMCPDERAFICDGVIRPDMKKEVKWCLAKDDVTPKDIFEMTKGSDADRAIIAKYCIQDCNIVQHLFKKTDIMTGIVEMSSICSVPINFIIMRGQGIKLLSLVAQKCRDARILMPDIDKGNEEDAYEGAIVLPPKCGLYLDNPVACVDYGSLYPSSMLSENLSHDTKVWTKEYDLQGNLIEETGSDEYDNLPEYKYVDVKYDTFKFVKKTEKGAYTKVCVGSKVCRFAQFPHGKRGILPTILAELLSARKTTRVMATYKALKDAEGNIMASGLLLNEADVDAGKATEYKIKDKDGKTHTYAIDAVESCDDLYDDFMQNVLDKRQLGYKVTANSLYGQCGAKTSAFYEQDVASATTATGRKLLFYARSVVENVYGNKLCQIKNGRMVATKAEYIYGDSVASYTPVWIKINDDVYNIPINKLPELLNKQWTKCEEIGRETKEVCDFTNQNVETWTEKGWTTLQRVIRHALAPHKKMIRVVTADNSAVDVTDEHSLLRPNGDTLSPKDAIVNRDCLMVYRSPIGDEDIKPDAGLITDMIAIDRYMGDGYVYDLTTENHHFAAGLGNIIVHNTDSVFFTFNLTEPDGVTRIRGKEALEITIELAQEVEHVASKFLKQPHVLEYEKTFMPFCLLRKKGYVGMLHEKDPNKGKRKSMGIVLKRRDNAPIVKDVYGGIIDILMNEKNVISAIEFTKRMVDDLKNEKIPIEKLVITKSLRGYYKNPNSIAHKVLADRMGKRDAGNKPAVGDRIPYVYIQTPKTAKGVKLLQGDKIEHPLYVMEHKLKLDYEHYITNQIMKPVAQLFSLVLEEIPSYKRKLPSLLRKIEAVKSNIDDPEKQAEKIKKLRNEAVNEILFDDALREITNKRNGVQSIRAFF